MQPRIFHLGLLACCVGMVTGSSAKAQTQCMAPQPVRSFDNCSPSRNSLLLRNLYVRNLYQRQLYAMLLMQQQQQMYNAYARPANQPAGQQASVAGINYQRPQRSEKPAKPRKLRYTTPKALRVMKLPVERDDEARAASKLQFAKYLANDGLPEKAKAHYQEIIAKYAGTEAAAEAKRLLNAG